MPQKKLGIVRKDATIENTGPDDAFPGTFSVILSAPTEDRDGDVLLPDEWDLPLPKHITFDQDHGMSVASTVGSGEPYLDKQGRLIVDGAYSSLPRAQEVRTLVNEGHIRTTSVAFMNKQVPDTAKGAGKTRVVRELLNGAFVAIPSNREALVLGSKSGARNSKADAAMLQTMHDHSVALGAACSTAEKAHAGDVEFKTVRGSLEQTQEQARSALQAAAEGAWVYLRATVPGDGGGTLIYSVEDPETYEMSTYQQDYTVDGGAIVLAGNARPVTLEEVISGNAGTSEANGSESEGEPTAAETAAAKAATVNATDGTPAPDETEALALEERRAQYRALHRLAATI